MTQSQGLNGDDGAMSAASQALPGAIEVDSADRGHDFPVEPLKVLITGGSRGIGLAAAHALVEAGAQIALLARDAGRLARARGELAGDVVIWPMDLSDPASVLLLTEKVEAWGTPDAVIASAALMSDKASKLAHTSPEHWRAVMAANLDGVFHTLRSTVPLMMQRRSGSVIVLSACLGRMSGPGNTGGLAPYRVSKAAVNALVRNTAHEAGLGRRGVFVDAVCPGHCRTDMGGPDAPRSARQGADTAVWLAMRGRGGAAESEPTGVLWEDREVVPW